MSKKFAKTQSVCPVCLRVIEADKTVGDDGFIHFEKTCPDHGFFDVLIWEGGIVDYLKWDSSGAPDVVPFAAQPVYKGCPNDCGLCAAHKNNGCCVLLEITERCNLTCPVCFADAGHDPQNDIGLDEIIRQYDMLIARGGPFNIQLSGGEPTMRDDLADIVKAGRDRGFSFFQLNTNGLRIAEEDGYAALLKAAGISCVFLQFDGISEKSYEVLRGRPLYDIKIRALDNCEAVQLPVVLVPTVAPDVNDGELGEIIRLGLSRMPHVRGVHFQPISYFGRCSLNAPTNRLTIPRLLRNIEEQTDGLMKASDFSGGGAESPYCSFHSSYLKAENGGLRALLKRRASCCVKSSEARDFVSRQWGCETDAAANDAEQDPFDAFLEDTVRNTFTVSGMLFQDAMNLDLERLRRCYVCEADSERGLIPFCAYNLTDTFGRALYRK